MNTRPYLSIGEVLALLQDEFDDITISKIRFLESQGLIEPERTPSGYRKFYEDDVERLRLILREQKDHFLPLRVIKSRLDSGELTGPLERPNGVVLAEHDPAGTDRPEAFETGVGDGQTADSGEPDDEPRSWSIDELALEVGVPLATIEQLVEFGLLTPGRVGGEVTFDAQQRTIAQLAGRLMGHGLEPRHLRMYRQAVDREVALYEQVVMPYLKQRNPEARARAHAELDDLSSLAARLRALLLEQSLADHRS